jgi:hypothetical protein
MLWFALLPNYLNRASNPSLLPNTTKTNAPALGFGICVHIQLCSNSFQETITPRVRPRLAPALWRDASAHLVREQTQESLTLKKADGSAGGSRQKVESDF